MSRSDVEESALARIARSCNISPGAIEDIYECTPTQIDLCEQEKPDIYQMIFSITPELSPEHLRQAFRLIVARNAILRTRFSELESGKTIQVVLKLEEVEDDIILPHGFHGVDELLRMTRHRTSRQWLGLPLFQVVFIGSKFVVTVHHGVMDYWSWTTLFNVDLLAAYLGHPVPDRPPFKDFVYHCNSIEESVAENFWKQRLQGVASCFPAAHDSEASSSLIRESAVRETTFEPGAIRDGFISQMPYYIEAAWAITSSIYAASDSVTYGYITSGRSSCSNGLQSTLGPTFNEVPIQFHLQRNMTVSQLVKDRATSIRQLQAHPAVNWGLDKIRAAIRATNNTDGVRYGTLLNILPEHPESSFPTCPPDTKCDDDVRARMFCDDIMPFEGGCSLHLKFKLLPESYSLTARFEPRSISESRLNLVLDQFEHVLRLLLQAPSNKTLGSLVFLNQWDRARISTWNSKLVPEETAWSTVHTAFHAQARVRPEATAVTDMRQMQRVSYHALEQMSDGLAKLLRSRGISSNVPVCLVSERSTWAIVAILGIMKSGGIFVPVDRKSSREDRAVICCKAQPRLVLASSSQYAACVGLVADVLVLDPDCISQANSCDFQFSNKDEQGSNSTDTALLHFQFTGGSTRSSGAGKETRGIMLAHRSLVSSATSQARAMGWQPGSRVLHSAEYASSWSMCEVFGTLLSGGCICIPPDENPPDENHSFADILPRAQADWAIIGSRGLANTTWSSVRNSNRHLAESVLLMREPRRVREWTARATPAYQSVFRGWGRSETGFISTTARVPDLCAEMEHEAEHGAEHEVEDECIGFPIASCSSWIVSPHNVHDLAPVGSMGELLFSGAGIAQGYWGDDAKAANSFISSPRWAALFPFAAETDKFYRTGYLAYYNPDGSIALVGKRSNRIRIRGYTTQLEHLERTLLHHCLQLRDVVCLTQIHAGGTQVVALVCLADSRLPSQQALQRVHSRYQEIVQQHVAAIRGIAESKLPAAVVPGIWHAVERLPCLDDGDLDRHRIRQWLSG
ncbi:NRPS protein [Claviceps africana]|uniref:NRPS protein n=1 Tax=Claviceps africana TaxID=83212 RepID=A0A8K0JFC9_9HYPO|nr:NRPS protein [Claviceps africana]